jgi:protein AbiQ
MSENENLKLYKVDTDYINYLKNYQHHIWDNEDKKNVRPYVGIILTLNNYKYYAPLSSPKPKHQLMTDRLDFIRIDHKNELKCVINLNNMIPVDDSNIALIDIDNEDEPYRSLLITEIIQIRKKQKLIQNNARILYNKVTKHADENPKLVRICYDFNLLEQKCKEYQELKQTLIAPSVQIAGTKEV